MLHQIFILYTWFIVFAVPIIWLPITIREHEIITAFLFTLTPFILKFLLWLLSSFFNGSFSVLTENAITEKFVKTLFVFSVVFSILGAFILKDDGRPLGLFYVVYAILPVLWIVLFRIYLLITTKRIKGAVEESRD